MKKLFLAALLLTGCVSPSTLLVNQDGNGYRCATTGWGWGGIMAAEAGHSSCVKDYQRLGYVKLPETTIGTQGGWNKPYVVTKVFGPAEAVGIKPGDEIVAIDGKPVDGLLSMYRAVDGKSVGDKIKVTVKRENKELYFEPVLMEQK